MATLTPPRVSFPIQHTDIFTLEVEPGETVPCIGAPGAFHVTMAAIDPTAPPQPFEENPDAPPRATLKIIRHEALDLDEMDDSDDEDDDGSDVDAIERRLGLVEEDDSEDSDEEVKGGPSDPEKVKKARLEAVAKSLANGVDDEEDEDVDMANGINGKVNKGKGKATGIDEIDDNEGEEEDEEEDDDDEDQAFVVCTLDTTQHYQQPLNLLVVDPMTVSFQVIGTHSIHLTGMYVEEEDSREDDSSDDELNGLIAPYDEDEEESVSEDEESDELDGLEDPKIKEIDSDEEEVPKLIKALKGTQGKGKNKRPAESDSEEEGETLDSLITKTAKAAEAESKANGEQKLSKKQLKKLKKNDGQAAPGAQQPTPPKKDEVKVKEEEKKSALKDSPGGGKKVQFAKNLEQGPTGSPKVEAKEEPKKANGTVKTIQGVKVDDRKEGSGSAAKKGDRIGMRYIGKLEKDNKVFDSNKKGKPFTFKLGSGEVIKGWDIGVVGMKVGGERRVTIPAHLAYGSKGQPGIPANSTLVFDLKLLTIN